MGNWYEEAVFYHIYPLGLTGAPRVNNKEAGDGFEKLKLWIPHMKEMGFTALYIGPLFESSTHGYDTKDYRQMYALGKMKILRSLSLFAIRQGFVLWWMECLTIPEENFLHFRIFKPTGKTHAIRIGIRELTFGGIPVIMMALAMKHGEIVLSL